MIPVKYEEIPRIQGTIKAIMDMIPTRDGRKYTMVQLKDATGLYLNLINQPPKSTKSVRFSNQIVAPSRSSSKSEPESTDDSVVLLWIYSDIVANFSVL